MAKGVQAFRANEIKRAVEALQKSGVKIARVSFGDGRFDIITADDPKLKSAGETTEDLKKLL
jgi:hypothetical protein